MAKDKEIFKSEEEMSAAQAAEIIREIADGLEAGSITLSNGDEITLEIPATFTLELEAEEEEENGTTKRSLEIEIDWVENSTK